MNITIERLEQIETERQQTVSDPQFQAWMKQLNVSRMYISRDGIHRANQMMEGYNYKKTKRGYSYF